MALTPQQRRDFDERGWFHLGRVFGDAELDEIRAEYDRILERPMRLQEEGKRPFEYSPLLHVQSDRLRRHATSPKLAAVGLELLGPDVRLYWDQAVSKPAGAESDVPWHQDNGYTPVFPHEYLTFTVALDATTRDNGCLWLLPGSHRNGVTPHEPTDLVFYRGYDGDEPGVPVEQEAGDVLVFSSLTLHRSGPNQSPGPRRSWIIQLCRGDTRHEKTGVAFDDRLLVARAGVVLAEPVSERPIDLEAIARAGWRD